jgi:HD superfamily phosphodiesterase
LVVTPEDLVRARTLLAATYQAERTALGSPITDELVQLNLAHTYRVQYTVQAIADGEGLDSPILELAAVLHDVAKLDHRDSRSGGIDTWHHHYRGSALARKLVLAELGKSVAIADRVAAMIEAHSDIPFISRYWRSVYGTSLPSPRTAEELALRDADMIDVLWVGGFAKIVQFRQIPGTAFHREDGGNIQKAIASALNSFHESSRVLRTPTARALAAPRILAVEAFCLELSGARSLKDFSAAYWAFLSRLGISPE